MHSVFTLDLPESYVEIIQTVMSIGIANFETIRKKSLINFLTPMRLKFNLLYVSVSLLCLNSLYPLSFARISIVKSFTGDFVKLSYIQQFAISVFILNKFYCIWRACTCMS